MKREFTKEEVEKIVSESFSYRTVAEKLGYNINTGHYTTDVKKWIEKYNCDTSHFTGSLWNKGKHNYEKFVQGRPIKNGKTIREPLIALRGHKCEQCGIETWQDKEIPLEVHHINGIHNDNRLENLILLCPNCHSITDNWRGKNTNCGKEKVSDEELLEAIKKSPSIFYALNSLGLTGGGNYKRAKKLIEESHIKLK